MRPRSFHVSPNRLEGSLCDTSMGRLLESCQKHLITGTIAINTPYTDGVIELRAGWVDRARFGELTGDAAVRRLKRLGDGMYILTQRLPDLSGSLGEAASGEGDLTQVPLVTIMRHCEDQALSCTITLVREFDRAEIVYRAGEIASVELNGARDDDAIVDIVNWPDGRFRISAPPLAVEIDGWPAASQDPTAPFRIEHATALRNIRAQSSPPRRTPRGTPAPLPGMTEAPVSSRPRTQPPPPPRARTQPPPPPRPAPPPATPAPSPAPAPRPTAPAASTRPSSSIPAPPPPPRTARASSSMPAIMPLFAEPFDPDAGRRRRGRTWPYVLLALVGAGVVAGWVGAMYYIYW